MISIRRDEGVLARTFAAAQGKWGVLSARRSKKGGRVMQKICGLAIAVALASVGQPTLAAEAGDQWQVTSTMAMPGMPAMPARTSTTCTAKTWSQPPGGVNSS